MMDTATANPERLTPRQQQVLSAALDLLVESGDRLTMTAVARRASCSKETLYKWFGGRDGLLAAIVQWQAAKVRIPPIDRETLDTPVLGSILRQIARDLLATIAGEVSIALNRLAIAHATTEGSEIAAIMRAHGPAIVRRRCVPVLEAGRARGLLGFAGGEEAYRTFFGLVVRDTQIRLLLGEQVRLDSRAIEAAADAAVAQFLDLFTPTQLTKGPLARPSADLPLEKKVGVGHDAAHPPPRPRGSARRAAADEGAFAQTIKRKR
jgi:AcrR family transcriptional regulator